ncbi:MAG: phage recombination protein Bet [Mycobacteriaceae bacterium]
MTGSTATAIAIRDDQTTFDDLQKRALAHIGVETANPADLAVFFHTCKRTGLDPFARQIYMIRRDGKQTMQTGIDGLRLIAQRTAERTGETFGYEDTQWCGEDGQWRDVWLSSKPPAAARVTVIRNGQRFPFVALFGEYVQRKRDGDITKMWTEKGALMLGKCAEAGALRKAFPQDLSGLYTTDEMARHDQPREQTQRVSAADFAPKAETVPGEVMAEIVEEERADTPPEQPSDEWPNQLTDGTRGRMFALFNKHGITDRDEQIAGITRIIGRPIQSRSELTEDEAQTVIRSVEAHFAAQAQP